MIGFNFKISNLLAAIGYGQLKKNKKIINKKKTTFENLFE